MPGGEDYQISSVSLAEHLVLALVAASPAHGFDLGRLLDTRGPVGRAYRVPRAVVYRSIDRLVAAGLVEEMGTAPGRRGPPRTVVRATPTGVVVAERWLQAPVEHVRDIRTELMAKLAVLHYTGGGDLSALLEAQRGVLGPVVETLTATAQQTEGFEAVLAAWRLETARAALRFVETTASDAGDFGRRSH